MAKKATDTYNSNHYFLSLTMHNKAKKIQKFSQEAQVMPKSESWMFPWFIVKHVFLHDYMYLSHQMSHFAYP